MRTWILALSVLAACGDNFAGPDAGDRVDAGPDDVLVQLQALPGVTVQEWFVPPGQQGFYPSGVRFFDLGFTQPIDHADAAAGTFVQYAALIHVDPHAPLVVYTSGYDAGWTRWLTEPAALVGGNQLSLEYRFYADSRPAGAVPWDQLRVVQATADQHAVLTTLASVYDGARIMTGGSKGGEHALQFAQHYPDDVDGVVAYVPPVITAYPDHRYDGNLDVIGTAPCRAALRAVARELMVRHAMVERRAAITAAFDVVGVAHAVETAIAELEFSFWMTRGEDDCDQVPAATAGDEVLWQFLDDTSAPSGYGDADLAVSGTAYLFQDTVELGYPTWDTSPLADLLQYDYDDWSAYLPASEAFTYDKAGTPSSYDGSQAQALAAWVATTGEHIMTINGEWDPWAAGAPVMILDDDRDALDLRVAHGSHWSSGIYSLSNADGTAAIAALRRWAGVADARIAPVRPLASMATRGPGVARTHRR